MMVATTAVAKETMRAIVQEGYGSADALHLREIPRPTLAEGRVLIRVRAASVNAPMNTRSTLAGNSSTRSSKPV